MARLVAPFDSLPTVGQASHVRPAPKIPADVAEWLDQQLTQHVPNALHRHATRRFLGTAAAQAKGWGWYYAKIELTETITKMTSTAPPVAVEVGINARDASVRLLAKVYASVSKERMRECSGLAYAEEKLHHEIQGDTVDSQLSRIQDQAYWKREIRKALRPWRELWHLALAPQYLKYASPEAITEYESMQENGRIWAEAHEMTAPTRDAFPLPTPAETAKNRYAQLVAMTKGIETLAGEAGMTAEIITITLDTEFHARTTHGGRAVPNGHYDDTLTPGNGHSFLNSRWARFRAALKRRVIKTYWVLGAQPHSDETPHWHVVLWSTEDDKPEIKKLIYRYFKTNDNARQIDMQSAKSEAGASSYAMRMLAYITRQTNTIPGGSTDAVVHEAVAASAWASTWRIRRYRTSHTAATLWKLARNSEIEAPDDLKKAVLSGDFAAFYKLKNAYACSILYKQRTGKYGDSYQSPRGIEYVASKTGEISTTWKQTNWTVSAKLEKSPENQRAYSYSKEPRKEAKAEEKHKTCGFGCSHHPPNHRESA
jgi:hypothetical protein